MPGPNRPPVLLLLTGVLFLVGMGYVVAASLTRRAAPTFMPTTVARRPARAYPDTVTLDATDGERWRYFDLAAGAPLAPPETTGWDIAVRRYRIRADAGAVANLGPVVFDSVVAPSGARAAGSSDSASIGRWYEYRLLSHLLESRRDVYLLRTRDGAYVQLQLLGYYCPGLRAGCVTFRYAPLDTL
jgi:hypothetical protein